MVIKAMAIIIIKGCSNANFLTAESFITSTSFCICPVASINGVTIGDGAVPGPVTNQLIDGYVDSDAG